MKSMRKVVFFMLAFFAMNVTVFASELSSSPEKKDSIVLPEFPGGHEELSKYLLKELQYPYEAQEIEARGEVLVEFFVERSGSITGVHVIKSASPELDAEAVRVIRKMPRWTPGSKNGVPMRSQMSIPINFRYIKGGDKYVDGENMDNGFENRSVQQKNKKLD